MRFVDIAYVEKPAGFDDKVAAAAAAVAAGEAKIGDRSSVWSDCKVNLKNASYQKCFYCEMKDMRSDGTVDHYRPKSKYKWAAFRLNNFRFACTFCNSRRTDKKTGEIGGKGKDFPLLEGCERATCEAEECHELPLLLDPCDAADPDAIDFRDDGVAVPKNDPKDNLQGQRAKESIVAYHLNHSDLTEARRCLAVELLEKIVQAETAMERFYAGDATAKGSYTAAVRDLKRRIKPESEHSVFARRILQTYKNRTLVESVLAAA